MRHRCCLTAALQCDVLLMWLKDAINFNQVAISINQDAINMQVARLRLHVHMIVRVVVYYGQLQEQVV